MRFYPNADINNYWEISSAWSLYCRNPHKSWKRRPLEGKHTIAYWRDLDGAEMPSITEKDLYFEDWPHDRIRSAACLPWYYCVGNRFILLEKAFPAGFKCTKLPMNLKEKRELKRYKKQMAKNKRAEEKAAKKVARAMEELARKKKEQRGEIKT